MDLRETPKQERVSIDIELLNKNAQRIRTAFRIANSATPTSAKTASQSVAMPNAPNSMTNALTPSANPMFCHTTFRV